MTKRGSLRIINTILFLVLLSQVTTGVGRWLFGYRFIDYILFRAVHIAGGLLFLFGASLHIVLNWNWIRINLLLRK